MTANRGVGETCTQNDFHRTTLNAEESVIGSILIDNGALNNVSSFLRAGDFYGEKNRWCYRGESRAVRQGRGHQPGHHGPRALAPRPAGGRGRSGVPGPSRPDRPHLGTRRVLRPHSPAHLHHAPAHPRERGDRHHRLRGRGGRRRSRSAAPRSCCSAYARAAPAATSPTYATCSTATCRRAPQCRGRRARAWRR